MTTYNTGNPVPSADARDRYDNSQTLDEVVNGESASYATRTGKQVISLGGMNSRFNNAQAERSNEFNQFLEKSAYETPVAYAPGISITRTTQTVLYNGELYRPKAAALPFVTTTFAADELKWSSNGDNSLRQELATRAKGANMVWGSLRAVDSFASLTTAGKFDGDQVYVKSYYAGWAATIAGATGGGPLAWNASSTAIADGGSVFAVAGVTTGRWMRLEFKDALDFGCIGDGVFDNLARAIAYGKWAYSRGTVRKVIFPPGIFKMSDGFILDLMPFSLDQFEHRFGFEGAGVEITKFVFSGGARLIGFDFQTIGGTQTDIRRFDISGFTITDTRYAGGISFSPATALHFVGAPDSRFHDIFVVGCNEGMYGQAVFGAHITNVKTKYTRRGITLNGDAVAGFSNTDTVSPVIMEKCEIMGSAANITDGWGLKVTNAISMHCQRNRFENWISVPSVWFEGVRGSSISYNYIEGSYAAHAIRLGGRGTIDKEADLTRAVMVENNRFYDSLGIVFLPGASNNKVSGNYFHFGLSTPISDRTSNIHVSGATGQLGTILHDNEIDSTNVFTSEIEPTELVADARFGMFTRNGIYYGRKAVVDGTWTAFYPTTLSAGKTILPSNFAADGAFMGLVERGGTKGTITATGTTTSGSATVVISNVADLYPTNYITIAGAVTRAMVLSINRSTGSVVLDTACSSSVSGAIVSYEPPIIRRII